MTIETKYEYIYYTVVDISVWRIGNEELLGNDDSEFTCENAIEFIEDKFKQGEDKTVNNYRVDYAQYCDDINYWVERNRRNKVQPVFVQFQDDQPIKLTSEGQLFVLYEKEEQDENITVSPDYDYGLIDGLAGAGGRL